MNSSDPKTSVMVAGVGGASLGTEILKALRLAGGYKGFGCDISKTAYGLYDPGFEKTYLVEREDYVESVIGACNDAGARYLIPGGEQPMTLLCAAADRLSDAGIQLLGNSPEVIATFSNKATTFAHLSELGISVPRTRPIENADDVEYVGVPCIVKPSTGSGGSNAVFYAVSVDEALMYAAFIRRMETIPVAQEYVGVEEGEFTIGVLSLPNKDVVASIALRRALDAKLSVAYRGRGGVVSSGYSQGYIDHFPELCAQAEKIAVSIGSCGPINVQGRVRDGHLLPFEINPRFSASSHLRAMAGANEIEMLLRYHISGIRPERPEIHPGWYLRSLTESFIPAEAVDQWSTG